MVFPLKCRVHVAHLDLASASIKPFYPHKFFCILQPTGIIIVDRSFSDLFDVCGNCANACQDPFRGDLQKLRKEIAYRGHGALISLHKRRKHCAPWRDPVSIYHAFGCAIRRHVVSACMDPGLKDALLCDLSEFL
jgi:hypothetical protein